jgi:transcriptional regulator with XRE-family HTH domain
MTPEKLKTIRKTWNYSQPEFAELLGTKLRTYQDWEQGKSRIPGIIGLTLVLLRDRDERITKVVLDRAAARIAEEYPAGIPSLDGCEWLEVSE